MTNTQLNLTNDDELLAACESLLFIYGESVAFKTIARVLKIDNDKAMEIIYRLQENMRHGNRGLRVIVSDKSAQFVTAPELGPLLREVVNEEFSDSLSAASLETLSIIAYRGPIGRGDIDFIRGVNSSFILRSLLIRGLIERYENPQRKRSYLYKVSFDLMRMIGVEKLTDLPEFEKYNKLQYESDDESAQPFQENHLVDDSAIESDQKEEQSNSDELNI